jgi:hypothetical protein
MICPATVVNVLRSCLEIPDQTLTSDDLGLESLDSAGVVDSFPCFRGFVFLETPVGVVSLLTAMRAVFIGPRIFAGLRFLRSSTTRLSERRSFGDGAHTRRLGSLLEKK